jgi:hypothetical protein
LCKRLADYPTGVSQTQLDLDSIFYLTKVAPRLADATVLSFNDLYYDSANPTSRTKSPWTSPRAAAMGLVPNVDFIDWDGSGSYTPGTPGSPVFTLEGDQCLVFFLGGARAAGTGLAGTTNPPIFVGYSGSQFTPMDTTGIGAPGGSGRVGPYFEFDAARLVDLPHPGVGQSSPIGFFSYLDPFGKQPYAYFSAYANRAPNSYSRYTDFTVSQTSRVSDCQSLLSGGLWPYAQSFNSTTNTVSYVNPNTYQLISGGPDGKWGPGTVNPINPATGPYWTAATAGDVYGNKDPGFDDMSNFHERSLGVSVTAASK